MKTPGKQAALSHSNGYNTESDWECGSIREESQSLLNLFKSMIPEALLSLL